MLCEMKFTDPRLPGAFWMIAVSPKPVPNASNVQTAKTK
jgi:hypothetical protein